MDISTVVLSGRLTRGVESKESPGGTAWARGRLAFNTYAKDTPNGKGNFIDIVFFGRTAEVAQEFLGKGSPIVIAGRLEINEWTDKNGVARSTASVAVADLQLPPKPDGNTAPLDVEEEAVF